LDTLNLQVALDGTWLFNILVGRCHNHIHHNSLIRSLTHFGNSESVVHLTMGSQAQYQESLAVARAADHTQGHCYQGQAFSDILFPVDLDTTTVQDKVTQGKVVLRNPAEGRLDTGTAVQGPRNSSLGVGKMVVLARLRSRTERESDIRR